jgi:hypothetical protein
MKGFLATGAVFLLRIGRQAHLLFRAGRNLFFGCAPDADDAAGSFFHYRNSIRTKPASRP